MDFFAALLRWCARISHTVTFKTSRLLNIKSTSLCQNVGGFRGRHTQNKNLYLSDHGLRVYGVMLPTWYVLIMHRQFEMASHCRMNCQNTSSGPGVWNLCSEHYGVSSHRWIACLLGSVFRPRENINTQHYWRSLVDSVHKGPVMRKASSCNEVTMVTNTCQFVM